METLISKQMAIIEALERQLEIEHIVLDRLRQLVSSDSDHAQVTPARTRRQRKASEGRLPKGPIPRRLIEILRAEGRAMSAAVLKQKMEAEGFSGPSVFAALARGNWFKKVDRGLYGLAG